MFKITFSALLLLTLVPFGARAAAHVEKGPLAQATADWPQNPKLAIEALVAQYGLPNEMTNDRIIWYNNGVWKRTIVYKEEIEHLFPKRHTDFLEQTINYLVPPQKFTELALYDGSVIVERTKGEMTARCDKEANNLLALNLAKDIIDGKLNVKQARLSYAKDILAVMKNEKPSYTQALQFALPKVPTGDPDHSIIRTSASE